MLPLVRQEAVHHVLPLVSQEAVHHVLRGLRGEEGRSPPPGRRWAGQGSPGCPSALSPSGRRLGSSSRRKRTRGTPGTTPEMRNSKILSRNDDEEEKGPQFTYLNVWRKERLSSAAAVAPNLSGREKLEERRSLEMKKEEVQNQIQAKKKEEEEASRTFKTDPNICTSRSGRGQVYLDKRGAEDVRVHSRTPGSSLPPSSCSGLLASTTETSEEAVTPLLLLGRRSAPGQEIMSTFCSDKQQQLRNTSLGERKDDQSQAANVRGTTPSGNVARNSAGFCGFSGFSGNNKGKGGNSDQHW